MGRAWINYLEGRWLKKGRGTEEVNGIVEQSSSHVRSRTPYICYFIVHSSIDGDKLIDLIFIIDKWYPSN